MNADGGIVVCSEVGVGDVTWANEAFRVKRSLLATGSKFVPLIVSAVPELANVGVNPVIVGRPTSALTMNPNLLADPPGAATPMLYGVSLAVTAGTVTTSCVGVVCVTVAPVPLNVTWFCEGTALKFAPEMVTELPTRPAVGIKLLIATPVVPGRSMLVILPTGSYR